MSKYKHKKHQQVSAETVDEALQLSRSTQKPNQTKEQTRLIAQGIQKGIAEFKKQQKNKSRELGKLKKKITHQLKENSDNKPDIALEIDESGNKQWVPWLLLIISWLGMALFVFFREFGTIVKEFVIH